MYNFVKAVLLERLSACAILDLGDSKQAVRKGRVGYPRDHNGDESLPKSSHGGFAADVQVDVSYLQA